MGLMYNFGLNPDDQTTPITDFATTWFDLKTLRMQRLIKGPEFKGKEFPDHVTMGQGEKIESKRTLSMIDSHTSFFTK